MERGWDECRELEIELWEIWTGEKGELSVGSSYACDDVGFSVGLLGTEVERGHTRRSVEGEKE